jgi:hypothetical protein
LTPGSRLCLLQEEEQDWWEAELDVPKEAGIINFVTNFANMWDNNGSKDYAIKVALPLGLKDAWLKELVDKYVQLEFDTRVAAEEESQRREIKRLEKRRKAQAMVRAVERRKVRGRKPDHSFTLAGSGRGWGGDGTGFGPGLGLGWQQERL